MAQQQIVTKPYVEELQDNDSLFVNHDGALRQIKKGDADFASGADMRAEVAAREAFEAREVAAREAFEKNETEARRQFETSVGEQIAEKANVDGYYEEMTVGDAEQLISTQFVEDNEPYLFRPTGGSSDVGNRAYLDKIVGGTVAWNQLAPNFVANNEYGFDKCTGVFNDGVATLTINAVGATAGRATIYNSNATKVSAPIATHKYFLTCCVKPSVAVKNAIISFGNGNSIRKYELTVNAWNLVEGVSTYNTPSGNYVQVDVYGTLSVGDTAQIKNPMVIDLTQMFGTAIADYIYSIEQSQAGAGVAWFKKLFPKDYYEYNAGELLSVEGLESHDTVGFNQWDEALESGGLYAETGLPFADTGWFRTKNFIPIFPSTAYYYKIPTRAKFSRLYFYDVDKNFVSYTGTSMMNETFTTPQNAHYMKFTLTKADYGTTYNHDICINLSDPSRNGEYEPYEKHSYPLDNSLTLRGIPKLDASNNLYYDGDEYTSDGKVKRKYGVVDLGTLNYTNAGNNIFYATLAGLKTVANWRIVPNMICTPYKTTYGDAVAGGEDKTISNYGTQDRIIIKDTTYGDSVSIRNGLSGTYLVYELATPTTETAEPFQHIQIVDYFGTEEFVSTGIVPVGHKTRYPANLRDKLQHLPDLASADGTYLIKQTGKQMSLIHMPAVFPDTPTEDGTYTLKTVVTGGVATLQWVAE